MTHVHDHHRTHRFGRDTDAGVILGVCAGLARTFDWPLWAVRLVTLGVAWLFPFAVVIAYLVAALLMPARSLSYVGDGDEREFWRTHSHRSQRS